MSDDLYMSGFQTDNALMYFLYVIIDAVLTPLYIVMAIVGASFGDPTEDEGIIGGAFSAEDFQ